ncbi:MAG TPA: cytochrome c-type biogenesis CcmF C-terminal domain-containing protein [Bryobacteraceae bacterium]|jgi:cytochrome c-type biogenesis protein CcmF|nr:cytochrome c-type biogenesis CcmF C-terminal domain-containing protein [Bryobacteraceae bacterium]
MENIGALAVLLAFCLTAFATIAAIAGKYGRRPFLVVSAERAVYATWGLLTLASAILISLLITGDYRLAYVAGHSNKAMPAVYKFTAWWGGQEGSLLLWSWLLATYSAIVVYTNRRKFRDMMPIVIAIMMTTLGFFVGMITFVASPFQLLMVGRGVINVGDGSGLSPLLQWWTMAIHPPFLYLGYVGFTVPFAFAMASLITRQPGEAWIHTTRRWAILTWLFQSTGILLGMGWAYTVLGWGGYWGWDPVENASLMPWITATAFLHSVMMQEKKGMMKVWNMVLVSATFLLSILGTTLTRTGLVASVHAFAQSPVKPYFTTFVITATALTAFAIIRNLPYLRSEVKLESVVSRESSFLFNNVILLASCFAVLWGTLFPVIMEALSGEKETIDAPYYNRVNIPIALFLLFLTGVGPLIAWRKSSLSSLRRAFLVPAISGFVVIVALAVSGIHQVEALIAFGLCAFVATSIVGEFWKGAHAIRAKEHLPLPRAAFELTWRNTRRYGGYLVHMGIVFMFIGFTGSAFNLHETHNLGLGQSVRFGRYGLKLLSVNNGDNGNYEFSHAVLSVLQNGREIDQLEPEVRFYKSSQQQSSIIGIRRRLNEDLYVNYSGVLPDNSKAIFQMYVFPLVSWIWIGYWVLLFGTIICLIPGKVRLQYARTEVIGIASTPATVES